MEANDLLVTYATKPDANAVSLPLRRLSDHRPLLRADGHPNLRLLGHHPAQDLAVLDRLLLHPEA